MPRKLLKWVGGKDYLTRYLLTRVPYTKIYVEPFFGGGSLFFARRPVEIEVINDINKELTSFWRVVKDPNRFAQLLYLIEMTPYSRVEFDEFVRELKESGWRDDPEVVRAFKFFYVRRNSISASGRTLSVSRINQSKGPGWYAIYKTAISTHKRLRNAVIECDDFEVIFRRYDSPEATFYCDPPYPLDSIRDPDSLKSAYGHVMSVEDHKRFLDCAVKAKGAVVISTYPNPMYDEILGRAGFLAEYFDVAVSAIVQSGKRARATEVVWRNRKAAEISSSRPLLIHIEEASHGSARVSEDRDSPVKGGSSDADSGDIQDQELHRESFSPEARDDRGGDTDRRAH